jgi:hypothetical protein
VPVGRVCDGHFTLIRCSRSGVPFYVLDELGATPTLATASGRHRQVKAGARIP